MKKIFLLLGLIVFVLTSCNSNNVTNINSNTKKQINKLNLEYTYDLMDIALDSKGNFYMADKEKVSIYNTDGKSIGEFNENLEFCNLLSINNKSIAVYDKKAKSLKIMDLKGMLKQEYSLDLPEATKMVYHDEEIFFLQNTNNNCQIIIFDLNTSTSINLDVMDVQTFSAYDDKHILIAVGRMHDPISFLLYDYANEKISEEFPTNINTPMNDIVYNEKDNSVYYLHYNSFGRYKLNEKVGETLYMKYRAAEDKYIAIAFHKMFIFKNQCFVLERANREIYVLNMNLPISSETLTVLTTDPGFLDYTKTQNTMAIISERNPYIQLKVNYIPNESYGNTLKTKLMAGDNDFDIFDINMKNATDYIKSDALVSFNKYPEIMNCFNDMFDGILNICSSDGTFDLYESDNCLIHPPVLGNKKIYPADSRVYCVNKKSKHINLCIEYLSTYLTKEVQLSGPYITPSLYKDISLYSIGKENNAHMPRLSSQANISIYMDIIKNSVPKQEPPEDFDTFRNTTLNSFFKDKISAEEAAKLIDDKAKMILGG